MFFVKPKIYKNYIEDWDSSEQIIVCENGVFKRIKTSSVSYIIKKTSYEKLGLEENNIEFDKVGETSIILEEKPHMKKKIPAYIFDTILKFYQVYAGKGLEAKINIWYDKISNEFFIDCPFQKVSTVEVTEYGFDMKEIVWSDELKSRFPEKYILSQRIKNKEIEKVMQTHSHHNMSCSFSYQDDLTDYFTMVGYLMSAVYKTVLEYPTVDLRYFVSPYSKGIKRTRETFNSDIVMFAVEDVMDKSLVEAPTKCDFNKLASHIGISTKYLFDC